MIVTQERYLELSKTLSDEELHCFEIIKEKTINTSYLIGTSHIDNIYGICEHGDDRYIYESYDDGYYVVPLVFKGLEAAREFTTRLFGSY